MTNNEISDMLMRYISGEGTANSYRQVSTPYAMVRLTSRVTMMDAQLLKTLICIARVSVKGVTDSNEKLYEKVIKVTGISRASFYSHLKKLKQENAVKKIGPFLLVNPMYVAIGRRIEVNRLHEIYNEIDVKDKDLIHGKGTKRLRNLELNSLISALQTSEVFLTDDEASLIKSSGL